MKDNTSHRRRERGSVLAYAVLSFLFLFLAVGLGVDLSHLYLAKTELQNTADAAALAGASALALPNPTRITTAVDRAVQIMNSNRYNFDKKDYVNVMSLASQRALVQFSVNFGGPYVDEATATADPDDIRFIRVRTPNVPINMFFSVLLLGATQSLDAVATSGLSVAGNVSFCPAPLSAVECPPGADCDASFWGTCPTADPHGIQADGCNPKRQFCKGCSYVIRSDGGNGPSAGNYQVLACAGVGAAAVRDALAAYGADCSCGNVSPNQLIETEPGVNAGPIAQGLNVRFDIYGGGLSYSTSTPPDANVEQGTSTGNGANTVWSGINYGQYTDNNPFTPPANGHDGVYERRLLVLPIINETEFTNGRTNVRVSSLGKFFMQTQAMGTNGDIKVEYVGEYTVGVVGLDPNGGAATNVVTPILYR